MNANKYAILMAGGVGSRFWPVSTKKYPKQFHDMLGTGRTLIQTTFDRLKKSIPAENIMILTNEKYSALVLEQLDEIEESQVITEPAMRNTAPCILYASLKIKKKNPDALILVAPSDHWIENEQAFGLDLDECFSAAAISNNLYTLGIRPTFPNTGYGYIQYRIDDQDELKKVMQFREKPNYDTAKKFISSGNFLWNAGIFVWKATSILKAFEKYQPQMYKLFNKGYDMLNTEAEKEFVRQNYPKAEDISIDYAILEKSKKVYVLPVNFDWNDLGTWGSLYDKLHENGRSNNDQNVILGAKVSTENSSRNIIFSSNKDRVMVLDGVNDYIIVDRDNVLLIYPQNKEQFIKNISAKAINQFGEL